MRFLYENEYSVLDLRDLNKNRPELIPTKSVIITFDDGYQDFYTSAFPILQEFRFPATVFLPTAYIGDTTRRFKNRDCLTWRQVRELYQAGVSFGSHTVSHPQLREIDPEALAYEVQYSKNTIEEKIGDRVESFCYPFAFPEGNPTFIRDLRECLQASGYEHCACTSIGTIMASDDYFFVKRLPINSRDDLRLFRAKLEGGYDWMGWLQHATKIAKAWLC